MAAQAIPTTRGTRKIATGLKTELDDSIIDPWKVYDRGDYYWVERLKKALA